ncbi:MAG: DUF5615 family PIN-like protein [bacterium]|nr:DUF5615 family PIN-like protein [bacterium]
MVRFLLDANLSHATAEYLNTLGYDAITVAHLHLEHADDESIVEYASVNEYILVTLDLDFGYLFRILSPHQVGIIILRLENQTVESVSAALHRLLDTRALDDVKNQKALIVVDEVTIRVRTE